MREPEARNVLKVAPGASEEEIRRAYRREALRCHPDKNPGHTQAATVSFQHVQTAFVVLQQNDAESRKENIDREKLGRDLNRHLERAKASLEVLLAMQRAEDEAFLAKTHWKRVPSRSRPGEFSYEHRSGFRQGAYPSQEPTVREIAHWHRSQNRSLTAEKRAAAALASGRPRAVPGSVGLAPMARWPKWRWQGRRDRADPEEVR